MSICEECGEYALVFDERNHQYHCTECGNTYDVTPREESCWVCGAVYKRYTDEFPEECKYCGTSLIE